MTNQHLQDIRISTTTLLAAEFDYCFYCYRNHHYTYRCIYRPSACQEEDLRTLDPTADPDATQDTTISSTARPCDVLLAELRQSPDSPTEEESCPTCLQPEMNCHCVTSSSE